jgi:hypothetical protein
LKKDTVSPQNRGFERESTNKVLGLHFSLHRFFSKEKKDNRLSYIDILGIRNLDICIKNMSDIRQKNVIICKPIIYGSIATYLGRKSEETKTHRWSIYVRGVNNEDLSYMISKVAITLHSSFTSPVRGNDYRTSVMSCCINLFFFLFNLDSVY